MRTRTLVVVVIVGMSIAPPVAVFAQQPTCEEQVALLQGYVQELAAQRSALEGRLVLFQQAELRKAPQTTVLPDAKAKMEQIDKEKARVEKLRQEAVEASQGDKK